MILSAQSIRDRNFMITPFHESGVIHGRSFGLSSCGYDVRLAQDVWLWPFWGRLASTIEHFAIPHDLCAEVKDKSTNARLFVLVQNTIIEPGWSGYLTLELTRFKPWPIFLKKGTPIAQIVFKQLDKNTDSPYRGKYNQQKNGPQKAILEGING